MARIKCPECGKEISDESKYCIHCGKPMVKKPNETQSSISVVNNSSKVFSVIMGCILEIFGVIIFFSFDIKATEFGGDFYTYSYKAIYYIAIALRWGLTGILFGLGALLQFHKNLTFEGKIITERNSSQKVNLTDVKPLFRDDPSYQANSKEDKKIPAESLAIQAGLKYEE